METVIIFNETQIESVVDQLITLMDSCKVFTFAGPLGAGKTTLIGRILKKCGVIEPVVTSPTFTYVNLYENAQKQLFYHFDLYRITSLQEFINAGFDEYLYAPNSWAFIEWPELIMPLLSEKVCHCQLEYEGHDRRITITTG